MTDEDNTPAQFESLGRRVGKVSPKSITIGGGASGPGLSQKKYYIDFSTGSCSGHISYPPITGDYKFELVVNDIDEVVAIQFYSPSKNIGEVIPLGWLDEHRNNNRYDEFGENID